MHTLLENGSFKSYLRVQWIIKVYQLHNGFYSEGFLIGKNVQGLPRGTNRKRTPLLRISTSHGSGLKKEISLDTLRKKRVLPGFLGFKNESPVNIYTYTSKKAFFKAILDNKGFIASKNSSSGKVCWQGEHLTVLPEGQIKHSFLRI